MNVPAAAALIFSSFRRSGSRASPFLNAVGISFGSSHPSRPYLRPRYPHATAMSSLSSDSDGKGKTPRKVFVVADPLPPPTHVPPCDPRLYRPFRLRFRHEEEGPSAFAPGPLLLVVSDPTSPTSSSVAVRVPAGAASDPPQYPGTAHWVEHCIFLGRRGAGGGAAAPVAENEYRSFLSRHGGRCNASTALRRTTYRFACPPDESSRALELLWGALTAPALTREACERELQAIDAEDARNRGTNDSRRRLQVFKHAFVSRTGHWYGKYTTGNDGTLRGGHEALVEYHALHYGTERMGREGVIVMIGPEDVDAMRNAALQVLQGAEPRRTDDPRSDKSEFARMVADADAEAGKDVAFDNVDGRPDPRLPSPFSLDGPPQLLTTRPLSDVRRMYLFFPVPTPPLPTSPRGPAYDDAYRFLAHLLGHEGRGSIFAQLQDRGFATRLSAGQKFHFRGEGAILELSVLLTEAGEKHWEEVVEVVLSYASMLRGSSEEELQKVWRDVLTMSQVGWTCNDVWSSPAYERCATLAERAFSYGTDRCLSAGYVPHYGDTGSISYDNWKCPTEVLKNIVGHLVSDNMIVERCGRDPWKKCEDDEINQEQEMEKDTRWGRKKEPWYGVEYFLSSVEKGTERRWNEVHESRERTSVTSSTLRLPRQNPYVPKELELCKDLPEDVRALGFGGMRNDGDNIIDDSGSGDEKKVELPRSSRVETVKLCPPQLLEQNKYGRLWHRLDNRYLLPKTSLTILLRIPALRHLKDKSGRWTFDTASAVYSSLLAAAFEDAVAQDSYDATVAGLHWSIRSTPWGLAITADGYDQTVRDLCKDVLAAFWTGARWGIRAEERVRTEEATPFFLTEDAVGPVLERSLRSLRSYFSSKRSDVYAAYHSDRALGRGNFHISDRVRAMEEATVEELAKHHRRMVEAAAEEGGPSVECFCSGNVSEEESKELFTDVLNIVRPERFRSDPPTEATKDLKSAWIPGNFLRHMEKGEQVDIHVQSDNLEDESGAVLVTFQSQLPAFKNKKTSSAASLKRSAALRLISQMLREPLFDTLRTKQQLGYVVTSSYDIKFSVAPTLDDLDEHGTGVVARESLVVKVVSKNVAPPEAVHRIDDFLASFLDRLRAMPMVEIADNVESLCKKLMRPKQTLAEEVNVHWGKIKKYAPECLDSCDDDGEVPDLPWETAEVLAEAIGSLERMDLIDAFESVVVGKDRSRIVSCVYGSQFPMSNSTENKN